MTNSLSRIISPDVTPRRSNASIEGYASNCVTVSETREDARRRRASRPGRRRGVENFPSRVAEFVSKSSGGTRRARGARPSSSRSASRRSRHSADDDDEKPPSTRRSTIDVARRGRRVRRDTGGATPSPRPWSRARRRRDSRPSTRPRARPFPRKEPPAARRRDPPKFPPRRPRVQLEVHLQSL